MRVNFGGSTVVALAVWVNLSSSSHSRMVRFVRLYCRPCLLRIRFSRVEIRGSERNFIAPTSDAPAFSDARFRCFGCTCTCTWNSKLPWNSENTIHHHHHQNIPPSARSKTRDNPIPSIPILWSHHCTRSGRALPATHSSQPSARAATSSLAFPS